MARINGPVSTATAGRIKRRDRELEALFGPAMVLVAKAADPACLELTADLMEKVHATADLLLRLSGKPAEQRKLVKFLPSDVRMVLCMWIMDMNLAAKLTERVLAGK